MADTFASFAARCLRAYFDSDPDARARWGRLMAELLDTED